MSLLRGGECVPATVVVGFMVNSRANLDIITASTSSVL